MRNFILLFLFVSFNSFARVPASADDSSIKEELKVKIDEVISMTYKSKKLFSITFKGVMSKRMLGQSLYEMDSKDESDSSKEHTIYFMSIDSTNLLNCIRSFNEGKNSIVIENSLYKKVYSIEGGLLGIHAQANKFSEIGCSVVKK